MKERWWVGVAEKIPGTHSPPTEAGVGLSAAQALRVRPVTGPGSPGQMGDRTDLWLSATVTVGTICKPIPPVNLYILSKSVRSVFWF